MRLEGIEAQVQQFFMQHIFEAHKVDDKTQERIASSRRRVPECLPVHHPPERRIEEIDDGQDEITCVVYMPFHNEG
jgi:hypothetical protein